MDYFTTRYLIWAVALGSISAVSLPLGSILGLQTNLRRGFIAVLAAFGAGALIAALAVELVAPTALVLDGQIEGSHSGSPETDFYALVAGALIGGLLFILLDQLVNARGGFLRRGSSTLAGFLAAISFKLIE